MVNNTQPQDTGAVSSIKLLDILESHYVNLGFKWGKDARNAAKHSLTYKQLEALMQQRELIAERRGERYQLMMLKHWATIHDRDVTVEDIDHILESFSQYPAQPLARETLAELERQQRRKIK